MAMLNQPRKLLKKMTTGYEKWITIQHVDRNFESALDMTHDHDDGGTTDEILWENSAHFLDAFNISPDLGYNYIFW